MDGSEILVFKEKKCGIHQVKLMSFLFKHPGLMNHVGIFNVFYCPVFECEYFVRTPEQFSVTLPTFSGQEVVNDLIGTALSLALDAVVRLEILKNKVKTFHKEFQQSFVDDGK